MDGRLNETTIYSVHLKLMTFLGITLLNTRTAFDSQDDENRWIVGKFHLMKKIFCRYFYTV